MDGALASVGAFFLTSLAIELTPGPNMAYLALVGVSRGRSDGMMAVAGVALGLLLLGAVVGVGLGSLILENRAIYQGVRWGGAAYLVWLAYDAWRDGQRGSQAVTTGGADVDAMIEGPGIDGLGREGDTFVLGVAWLPADAALVLALR